MTSWKPVLLVLMLVFGSAGSLFAGPLFCPGAGVDVDVAVSVPSIWFGTVNMPVLWMDQGLLGISVVPSFSFGGSGVHGFLAAEAFMVFSLSREKPIDLILGAGVGVGGYYHDGRGEITPVLDYSMSFLFNRVYLRLAGVVVAQFKYHRNLDSSLALTLGYAFGDRNR